jgi:hypothetical protein
LISLFLLLRETMADDDVGFFSDERRDPRSATASSATRAPERARG